VFFGSHQTTARGAAPPPPPPPPPHDNVYDWGEAG